MRKNGGDLKNMLCFVRWAECSLVSTEDQIQQLYSTTHTQTDICVYIKLWFEEPNQSVTCQARSGNRSSNGNMFNLPPVTPRLFIHPPAHTLRTLQMAHLHHSSQHLFIHLFTACFAVNGYTEQDCTLFGYWGGIRGLLCISVFLNRPVET